MKTKNRRSRGTLVLAVLAMASVVLTLALPIGALAGPVVPFASHLQQNWSKAHSASPTPLSDCVLPSAATGDDCYNPGTHLSWTLTLDVCTSSTTTCTGSTQSSITLTSVVALLPPGETYIAASQSSTTSPTSTAVFTTGSCSSGGAPADCVALSVPNDTYLRWNFSSPVLTGHPQAQFSYTANLTASDGSALEDWAIAHYTVSSLAQNPAVSDEVFVANPILDITKSCPASVVNNSAVVYNVTMSNSGHENASGVTMTDPAPAGVTFTGASATAPTASFLASQASWTGTLPANGSVTATYNAVIGTSASSVTNVANYTAFPAATTFIHHNASCTTLVQHPAISVVKTVDPTLVSDLAPHTIDVSANVTNTGDATLFNVTATDSLAGALVCNATTLAPGQWAICTGSYVIPKGYSGNYSNDTVVANGEDINHDAVTANDSASVQVIHPAISVVKTVDPTSVSNVVNNTISITALVTNTGDTTLSGIVVSDSIAGALSCPHTTLAPGASMNCTGSYVIPKGYSGNYSNDTVTANGTDVLGDNVMDNDSASVQIVHPAITVVKTVNPTQVVNNTNSTINITAHVTNTGDVTLYHVSVNDSIAGALTCPMTTLAPGASMNCTGSYVIPMGTPAGYSNDTVTATGCDGLGTCVNDTSHASVKIIPPSTPSGVTDTMFCPLPNGQFRIILNGGPTLYQLKSTNPGQFYYNVYSTAGWTHGASVTVTIPYPFTTSGAKAIQVFENQPLPTCGSSPPSTNINSQLSISPTTIGLSSFSPQNFGSVVTVTLTLTGPSISAGNQLWIAIHLGYGLKGSFFGKLAPGAAGCPTPANTGPCAQLSGHPSVVIGNLQSYTFGNSLGPSSTVASSNSFGGGAVPSASAAVVKASGLSLGLGLVFAVVGLVIFKRGRQAVGEDDSSTALA